MIPDAKLGLSRLEVSPDFPMRVVVDGVRDDQPIKLLHRHNVLEMGYCVEGSGTCYVADKILPFRAGDFTVITESEYHRSRSSPGSKSRWVWFFVDPIRLLVPQASKTLNWQPQRFRGAGFCNVISPEQDDVLASYVRIMVDEARQSDALRNNGLRSAVQLVLNQMHRVFPLPALEENAVLDGDSTKHASLESIAPALELIAHRFDQTLTVTQLAAACDLSVRSLQVHFSRVMNRSPREYLQHSRIQAAAAMLAEGSRSVTEIAFCCGFNSLSTFNRAFRSVLGTSPRLYARSRREQ